MARTKTTATIGFEAKLWRTADKLRNNMDAAETSGARTLAAHCHQAVDALSHVQRFHRHQHPHLRHHRHHAIGL